MKGCQSCSFYSRRAWNIFHYFQSWKVKVNLETRYLATPQYPKNGWDIFKIYFSDLDAIFSYKGVFFTNFQKANIIALIKTIFGTHFVCDFTFFAFSPLACQLKKIIPRFLGVKKAWCKNLYIFGENWQRNQISKVDYFMIAFSLMPQLSHSAMWYLCYESWCLQLSMCTLCWKFADVTLADGWW